MTDLPDGSLAALIAAIDADPETRAQVYGDMAQPALPYTDADLRAEAARQHASLTDDPDFMGVGEMMDGQFVRYEVVDPEHGGLMPPPGTPRWDELSEDEFDEAQRKIHDLINGAAYVSDWAVALGVAGLTPHPPIAIRCTTTGWEVAVQIATAPDTTDQARDELLRELRTAITETTCRVLGLKPA